MNELENLILSLNEIELSLKNLRLDQKELKLKQIEIETEIIGLVIKKDNLAEKIRKIERNR